mmetsp:Transcript_27175/g.41345  ORF Transcript_27175/g.41345 Transcript_27175/m.41345 type:complete len:374 (-) Transcript_27175:1536-2657(-)
MSDLLKAKYLPIFDRLFQQFTDDTSRYESKLVLLLKSLPLMNKLVASRFMKLMEQVLGEPASNSIFRNNINPLRVGLILYRVLSDVQEEYQYSEHSVQLMKDLVSEQLRSTLEMYNDPDELMDMVEQTDYEGNDCFWYLDEYDLYNILDCRIMDRVIQKKWNGKFDINTTMMDYSTSYTLLLDRHGLYATDRVFSELRHKIFTFDLSERTHGYKFHVWLHSMSLRFQVEASFVVILTVFFQYFMSTYTTELHSAKVKFKGLDSAENEQLQRAEVMDHLQMANWYLQMTMYVSFIHLLFPLNQLFEFQFTRQTNRKPAEIGMNFFNELCLFVAVIIWIHMFFQFQGKVDSDNEIQQVFSDLDAGQLGSSNIIHT